MTDQEWIEIGESVGYVALAKTARSVFAQAAAAAIRDQTIDESGYIGELVEWAYASSADIVESLAQCGCDHGEKCPAEEVKP